MKTSELIEDRKDINANYQKWVYMFFEKLIKNLRSDGVVYDIESANPILLHPTKKYSKRFWQISIDHTHVKDICTLIKDDNILVKWEEAHQLFTIDVCRSRSYGCKFIIAIEDYKTRSNSSYNTIPAHIRYIYKDRPEDLSQNSVWLCRKIRPIIDKTIAEFSKMEKEAWVCVTKRGDK